MPSFKTVAVIGAGAWGTALAGVAARAGRDVVLYARSSATAAEIAATRSNPNLPGVKLEASVKVTDDIAAAAAAAVSSVTLTPASSFTPGSLGFYRLAAISAAGAALRAERTTPRPARGPPPGPPAPPAPP